MTVFDAEGIKEDWTCKCKPWYGQTEDFGSGKVAKKRGFCVTENSFIFDISSIDDYVEEFDEVIVWWQENKLKE